MQVIEKPKHGSIEWLQRRHRDDLGRVTFGASDAPALMNASPFMTRADLWHSKRSEPRISETSAAMHVGNVLESALVDELGRRLGINMTTPSTMFREHRFTVTLDAVGYDNDQLAIIGEVKTTRRHRINSVDDIPRDYLWQCWAQMLVMDRPVWLIVLDRDMNINHFEIPRSQEALDVLMHDAELLGSAIDMNDERMAETMIETLSAEQIADMWKATPTVRELTVDEHSWVRDLADARDLKKQAETIEKAARDQLARIMLDAEIATLNGVTVLSWKEQAGRATVDLASLKQDHADLVATYTKQQQPIRVMRINTKGNNQ
jgi:predicted phage-related endonuclease